jgi:hypothetical protein
VVDYDGRCDTEQVSATKATSSGSEMHPTRTSDSVRGSDIETDCVGSYNVILYWYFLSPGTSDSKGKYGRFNRRNSLHILKAQFIPVHSRPVRFTYRVAPKEN